MFSNQQGLHLPFLSTSRRLALSGVSLPSRHFCGNEAVRENQQSRTLSVALAKSSAIPEAFLPLQRHE